MFSDTLLERLRKAKRVAALTGAGISAESGVPTFRGEEGLWKKYKPEELASFDAFMKNPELVWEWYQFRKQLISHVEPNPGHFALAQFEKLFPDFWLITQNVDGLHRKAGSNQILELHGNIMKSYCIRCRAQRGEVQLMKKGELPYCECGGLMRPDVVWFGEMLPEDTLRKSFQVSEQCDVFFTVGTSALVQPAASLPFKALDRGAYVVEINIERTLLSDEVDEVLIGPSGKILPDLLQQLKRNP